MAKRFDAARPPDGRHVSGMMSFACPIDGAGRGTRRRHGILIKPWTGSPMPATTCLDELPCNKIRQKLMFNPRETAMKLT
jgi:hypothetical protein